MDLQIVWFKRDLRIDDHRPLVEASRRGPVLGLYIYEPLIYQGPEFHPRDQIFLNQCLRELHDALRALGTSLITRQGDCLGVFQRLHDEIPFQTIWSHEETGNDATYQRDRALQSWCRSRGIPLLEFPQHGVFRPLKNRDGWAKRWQRRMNSPLLPAPQRLLSPDTIPKSKGFLLPQDLGLRPPDSKSILPGGSSRGQYLLESFLTRRGENYRTDMSAPLPSRRGCSRLSAHLAYGALSHRQVVQRTAEQIDSIKETWPKSPQRTQWLKSLSSFESRLSWHCHFMQKLEDEPAIEFTNFSRAYDRLDRHKDPSLLQAWAHGETGYPMIDACMKSLRETGWITFRMRAMVTSFASYHLWQPWQDSGLILARYFLDFEPGIHWSQMQMQSGTTGINAIRIYNPIKQGQDHDPDGDFVREHLPALKRVPREFIHAPWEMPDKVQRAFGCIIGRDYPAPIVDHRTAYNAARDKIWAIKDSPQGRRESKRVQQKHGSRRGKRR